MEAEQEKLQSRERWTRIMIIVTTIELLCALALAIVAHMTYYEQSYQSNMTDDFIKSWSAKPIVDVIAIDEA